MTLYRYRAVPSDEGRSVVRVGELSAESPAALRASLRRIGLQVIDVRPVRRGGVAGSPRLLAPLRAAWMRHLRTRRVPAKAEAFDGLATMLEAGLPLADAVATLSGTGASGGMRTMLADLRERIRGGDSLDSAMNAHAAWFDSAETAMVRAGRATGELPGVLRALAERHERAGSLSSRIVAALTYPAAVLAVGIGVVLFLSARTLPELTSILTDAGVQTPGLTRGVIATGACLRNFGPFLLLTLAVAVLLSLWVRPLIVRQGVRAPVWLRRRTPRFVRTAKLARALGSLAELVRTGVPLVEALRVVAPTVAGSLGSSLSTAAARIERGHTLADSLDDPLWFGSECRRLVAIGEASGELVPVLEKLAARAHRSATRAVDRLAALLEPAVILVLAGLIGLVVMGAVLPLVRLQEVIG